MLKQSTAKRIVILIYLIGLATVPTYAQPLAEGKDKFLGCGVDNDFHSNFHEYWNQVTPGNAGKWGSVEYTQDSYNWTLLDKTYNYARDNELLYKHHTLIWGNQQPGWITSLDSAGQRAQIEEWIRLVGERYPDMDFIDVVNEPLHAPPAYINALGGTGTTGWDWVVTSFELARKYCEPGVKLILNEYNVLHDNTSTDTYLRLIDTLMVRDLIDGIGIQGHYFEFKSSEGASPSYTYSIPTIKSNLNRLVATGLPVYITEFDINEANDNTQLENYKTYFPIFWENPGVKGITLWGYIEWDVWKVNAYILTERYVERPAAAWLRSYLNSPMPPQIISPKYTSNELRDPLLKWNASDSATAYNVQLSGGSGFTTMVMDTTTADTSLKSVLLDEYKRHYWRVNASNDKGTSAYSEAASFVTGADISSVENLEEMPAGYRLFHNYPNPFNPVTAIGYQLSVVSEVDLSIYNVLGERVAILVNEIQPADEYKVEWNAHNLPSGVYYYHLSANEFREVRKMILLR